jgi:cytochrome c biogenesis protein CcmG, thiol:disulfide interchange protein DsbE
MKRTCFILMFSMFSFLLLAQTNSTKRIPSISIKTLDGKNFNTSQISNDGKPIIISFWATWCHPCTKELSAIADVYDNWITETGVKLIAISIDDSRTINSVRPFVNARGWNYEIYLDTNGELKRAMGVNNVPHIFIINGNGEIVNQHTTYTEGSENELFQEIKVLIGK